MIVRFLLITLFLAAPTSAPSARGVASPRTVEATRDSTAHADSVVRLPEIVVDRARVRESQQRRPTAFSSELRAGVSGRAVESPIELLTQTPGVRVVRTGTGTHSTVSLRGAAPGQVAVYLDGMPLTSAAASVANLADLPATAIERIEVYRGGAPLTLGPGRPGGALNVVTGGTGGSLRVARGAFDAWEAQATSGFTRGALSIWTHAGYQGSDGDFRYLDDNGTPFNAEDDEEATRLNNRSDVVSGIGRVQWQPDNVWSVSLGTELFRRAGGFPGLGSTPAANARASLTRVSGRGELARALARGGRLALEGSLRRERSRFRDNEGQLGLGRHATDDRFDGEQLAFRAESPPLPWGFRVNGATSWNEERAEPRDAADGRADPPGSVRTSHAVTGEIRWQTFGGGVLLVAADRQDRIADRLRTLALGGTVRSSDPTREVRAPQLGARVRLPLGAEVRANWSDAERVPDFMELFGDQGGVTGNPDLRPENAEARDVGLAWSGEREGWRSVLEWARFRTDARDLIVFARHSQSSMKAQNVSEARMSGDELSLMLATPFGVSVNGAFTWQEAIDRGPVPFWHGKRLPQRPASQAYVRVDVRRGRWRVAADAERLGETYLDRYNRNRVDARLSLGAALGVDITRRARLTLEGKNLRDERAADVAGYPLPGRSFHTAIEVHLGPASLEQP